MPADSFSQSEALVQARMDIAAHKAEISHLREGVDDLKAAVAKLTETVDAMRDQLTEAKGGWRVLMLLGGASSVVGGAITWLAQQVIGKHP